MSTHTLRKPLAGLERYLEGLALIVLVVVVLVGSMSRAAEAPVNMRTADNFALLAGSTITNTHLSTVTGDIGLHPGTSVTGYADGSDSITHAGALHIADAVAAQAKIDLSLAYDDAASRAATRVGTELGGGPPLTAGVYDSAAGDFGITGALTLDAENIPGAVFIFQMESTLTTASASVVNLINGADACNVFWQVGSSATLGTGSSFKGNILAMASITLTTGVNIVGSALARSGAVTMDTNTITDSSCAAAASPTPTASPTPSPTASPTAAPTASPTPSPTAPPIASPTPIVPIPTPTATPVVAIPTPIPSPTAIPPAAPTPIVQIPIATPTPTPVAVLTPTATPKTSVTTSPSPTATTSTVAAPAPSPSGTGDIGLGGGPALPRTGAPIGLYVFVSLTLIAGGGVMTLRPTKGDRSTN